MSPPRVRVLYLSQRVGPHLASGGGVHVAGTLAALRERFEVEALVAEDAGVPVVRGAARRARRLVPARVRGLRHDLLLLAADRAFRARALAAARSFGPDVVYERSEYFAVAGRHVARALGVPLVLEVNGLFVEDARTMYRSLAEPLGGRLERLKHHDAAAVLTVSPGLAQRLHARGADPARTVVIPNAIDPVSVLPEPRPVDAESGVVGFVGHLMPWHRAAVELLVDVAPRLLDAAPRVSFAVVGGGPGLEELRDRAAARGLGDRFRFTGALPRAAVPGEVGRFDVGVIPAIFDYAFPVKLVEMGAAGVPVVAPQTPELDELLEPGLEYEPFAPGDVDAFVAAVRRVLAEPERRSRLGAALHAAVRERFTWNATGAALSQLIEEVAAR